MPTQAPLRSGMIWAVSLRSESITDMILTSLVPKNISSNVSKSQIPGLNQSLISACPGGCFLYPWKSLFQTIRNMFHILSAGQTLSAGGVVFVRGWACVGGFLGFMAEWFSTEWWLTAVMQYCCTLWSVLWGFAHSLHCTVSETQSL